MQPLAATRNVVTVDKMSFAGTYFLHQEQWGPRDLAFRIVSRNAPPRPIDGEPPLSPALTVTPAGPTAFSASGPCTVTFVDEVVTEDGSSAQPHQSTRDILAHPPEDFSILPCDNHLDLVADEFAAILSPFFFSDDQNTFFVEPSLEEVTTEEWEDWAIPVPKPDPNQYSPDWFKAIPLEPAAAIKMLPTSVDPGVIDSMARFAFRQPADWVTNEATGVLLGTTVVGARGGLGLAVAANPVGMSRASAASNTAGVSSAVGAGSGVSRLAKSMVSEAVVTVGTGGLNLAHLQALGGLRG
jgi:hypothetical protein